MAYLANIPQPDERKKDSQPKLLENFKTISALLGVDHVITPWTDPADDNQGKHKFVRMPQQVAAPGTVASEYALYTKSGDIFIQTPSAAAERNITGLTYAAGPPSQGSTTLPSGLILKWGANKTPGTGLQTVTFTASFSTIYAVFATISVVGGSGAQSEANDRYARIYNYTAADFSVVTFILKSTRDRVANDYNWFAIGI